MSKKPSELQAGALTAWTPIQQAALYHHHLAKQAEQDDMEALKEYDEEEKKKKKGDAPPKPDQIQASVIMDSLLKGWSPPLYDFLDVFGPPHIAIVPFVLLHLAFCWTAPWYLLFVLPYPLMYGIPIYSTLKSIYSKKDRPLWEAWWILLALAEYFEVLMFNGNARSLVWWPKMKALVFIALYSTVENEEKRDSRGGKSKAPVPGALKVIKGFLPTIEKEKKEDPKDKDKDKAGLSGGDKGKDASKDKEKERQKAKEAERAKARATSGGKEKSDAGKKSEKK